MKKNKYARLACQEPSVGCCDSERRCCCSANPFGWQQLTMNEPPGPCKAAPELPGDDGQSTSYSLQSLPSHLINLILDNLPPDSLLDASRVCKSLQHTIWQDRYMCRRLSWHHKCFIQPGNVASFKAKKRLLSCAAEHRLSELTDKVGKTMLLQF